MVLVLGIGLACIAGAAEPAGATKQPAQAGATDAPATPWVLEKKAVELLKATSARLAAAHSLKFTAVIGYESPSRLGPPLLYTTRSEVALQRPDKLRVITSGDGPPSEFYYDGKTMVGFAPAENLVAIAAAPPTIDDVLQAAYQTADIYFPFADVIVSDPYKDLAPDLKLAFYIGQSDIVGGTKTDMVAYASDFAFLQMWIGTEDKLPRRLRAVFREDPERLRHEMELSNWQVDPAIEADTFVPPAAAKAAKPIAFSRPSAKLAPKGAPPTPKAEPPTSK